jgi:hypothetical protein
MRQNLQQIGLILAILVASVSLPTAIISLTREPVINNNYNTDYNFYNQTYIGNNETDYSTPLEIKEYYNLDQYDCIVRIHNLSTRFVYWYYWNASIFFTLRLWVAQSMFYDEIVDLNGTASFVPFIDDVKVYERPDGNDKRSSYYTPPFEDEWLFIFCVDDTVTVNITLRDEILPI